MTRDEILADLQSLERLYQRGKLSHAAYESEKAALQALLSPLQGADAFETGHALPRLPVGWVEGGQIAGRYHLRALVGRGGMAEVWQAEDTASSPPTPVALKRLLASLAEHPSLQQRLAREIQILRNLRHPRLIQLIDAAPDHSFFAMEYLEGQTLRRRLQEGRLPLLETLRLVGEICHGLAALHHAGIVHRDLKPENLFLVAPPPFSLKILDVGIAFDTSRRAQTSTQHGGLGTAYYMAPEQLTGGAITPTTDLYALGILLYELVTGSLPLPGAEPLLAEVQHLATEGRLPPEEFHDAIASAYLDVCRPLSDLVAACHKKRPTERPSLDSFYQTLVSCHSALAAARAEAIQQRETTLERLLLRGTQVELQTFLDESHQLLPEYPRWQAVLPRLAEDQRTIEDTAASLQTRLGVEPLEGIAAAWFALASRVEAKGMYLRHPFHQALRSAFDALYRHLHQIDGLANTDLHAALRLLDAPPVAADLWGVRRLELVDRYWQAEVEAKAEAERRAAEAKAEAERLEELRKSMPPGFVACPAGSFWMGSGDTDREASSDEKPAHHVTLTRGFWMQATPVTQAEWQALAGFNPSRSVKSTAPVENVSWYEAVWFCNERSKKEGLPEAYRFSNLTGKPGQESFQIGGVEQVAGSTGYRLPTEAEWEYACRAGTTTPPSSLIYNIAHFGGDRSRKTRSVGEKEPNAWGLYDMLGNVWEWVFGWYGSYSNQAVIDPTGPATGHYHLLRGGSWHNSSTDVRAARRYYMASQTSGSDDYCGFRMVRSA